MTEGSVTRLRGRLKLGRLCWLASVCEAVRPFYES